MFGYVKINKDELKIKEYNTYKAVYCSLCRELGRQYGLCARLTLNYDFTFLTLLRLALDEPEPCFINSRCSFNPLVRCKKCGSENQNFNVATAVAMLMLYYKLLDNIADERFFKRMAARLLKIMFKRRYKKAAALYPQADMLMMEMYQKQRAVEKGCPSLDAAAHPTAEALGKLFALDTPDTAQAEILYRLGYCLGRYVYFIDALDDYKADRKQGGFNAFVADARIGDAPEVIRHSIGEAVHAYYLLTPFRYGGILENILTKGLNNTLMQVLNDQETERQM